MGLQKLRDPKHYKECCGSLRHGIWGNTWREWGQIALGFAALYSALAALFAACYFTAMSIRNDQFMSLPVKFFGPFARPRLPIRSVSQFTYNQLGFFNAPLQCTEIVQTLDTEIGPILSATGIQGCSYVDKRGGPGYNWGLYPWTLAVMGTAEEAGLDSYPGCQTDCSGSSSAAAFPHGCAQKNGTAFISRTTSPAYFADANVMVALVNPFYEENVTALVCQNNIPYSSVRIIGAAESGGNINEVPLISGNSEDAQ